MICIKCGKEAPNGPYCALCGWKQSEKVVKRSRRSNGEGRVWKRGKTWYAQIILYTNPQIVNGKKVIHRKTRTKGGFATKREASEYIPVLRGSQGKKTPTMIELYSSWEKTDLPKLSDSKQSAYKKARERLDGIMGRKIDTLTTSELQAIVDREARSYYTARDIKTLLSHLYNKALPDQYVVSNLSEYIVLPELEEKESEPFTAEEVEKMWTAFANGNVFVGYFLLMVYTGMMPGELFACRKDMIDYDRCEIWGCGKKTKTRKDVPIVFPSALIPVLEALCGYSESEKLQPHARDRWYDKYHRTAGQIGIRDLPPYSCRHTTGTEAAKLNLAAPIIQQLMRHSKITTTQKYIHLGTQEAHEAVNQMRNNKNKKSPSAP